MTERVSTTNIPPTMPSTISCLMQTAIAPSAPPKAKLPVSPMNTAAGGALYHKNPKPPPAKRGCEDQQFAHPRAHNAHPDRR